MASMEILERYIWHKGVGSATTRSRVERLGFSLVSSADMVAKCLANAEERGSICN